MSLEKKESAKRIYRKLMYYYDNKIPVHFSMLNKKEWKNGIILDLSDKMFTMVLNEFKEGERGFLLEEIKENSITKYRELEEVKE